MAQCEYQPAILEERPVWKRLNGSRRMCRNGKKKPSRTFIKQY